MWADYAPHTKTPKEGSGTAARLLCYRNPHNLHEAGRGDRCGWRDVTRRRGRKLQDVGAVQNIDVAATVHRKIPGTGEARCGAPYDSRRSCVAKGTCGKHDDAGRRGGYISVGHVKISGAVQGHPDNFLQHRVCAHDGARGSYIAVSAGIKDENSVRKPCVIVARAVHIATGVHGNLEGSR